MSNLFDLPPEEFSFYLEEGQYTPERRRELIEGYNAAFAARNARPPVPEGRALSRDVGLLENARRLGYSALDNLIGFDDDYETTGERFGRGIRETIDATRSDPLAVLGLVSEGIGDSYRRAATLPSLDQIRAGEAPGAVDALGFAGMASLGGAAIPRAAARAVSDAGDFGQDFAQVYHTTRSAQDFDRFDPDMSTSAMSQLGPHVGTLAAAEARTNAFPNATSRLMELRADTRKPFLDPRTDQPWSENGLEMFISAFADDQGIERRAAAPVLRQRLAAEGFTDIPYINDVEDAGSISNIMLVDRPSGSDAVLRRSDAAFDPARRTDPNLLAANRDETAGGLGVAASIGSDSGRDVAGALDDLRRSREAMLSASNETPFDELVRMSTEAAEARKRAVEALSTSEGGVRLMNPSNDRGVAVTPGLSGEEVGKFRLTFIDESRTPTNHVVYNTREEALEAALGAGFTQTLGPRPAASTPDDFGYYQDNPALTLSGGEEWLAYKQKVADDTYARRSGITGSTTATLGQRAEMFLPTDFLRRIPGLLNERRVSGEAQYDALLRNVQEKGFLPDQGGNKVLLGVNHRGEPFLIEGNTRVAVASDVGVPSVRAEVHYFNGGEMVEGQFAPENVAGIAASKPVSNYRDGGQVMMRSDMSSQMEGGIGGLSDRARDMFSRPRGVGTFEQYMNEGGSVGVSSDVIDRLRQRIIEETGTDPFDIAREEGIDPDLMLRVIQQESSGNPNAQSKKGAFGYMQLMPATAKELGVDRTDPVDNMRGGARYLRQQLDEFRTVPLALAAYNAGPGNVSKYGAIPPFKETIKYVSRITGVPFTDPSLGQTRSQAAAELGVVRPIARPADLRDPRAAQEDQILQLLQQSMQAAQPQQMQPQMQAAPQQPQQNPNPVQSSLRPIARPADLGVPQGAAPFAVPGQAVLPGARSVLPQPFGQ